MMADSGTVVTRQGLRLLADAQTGVKIEFTKVVLGDEYIEGELEDVTSLVSPKLETNIQSINVTGDGQCMIRIVITNQNLDVGFYIRVIVIFAKNKDGQEIPYSVVFYGDKATWLPPRGGADIVEYMHDLITVVDNAQEVTATIDRYTTIATVKDVMQGHSHDGDNGTRINYNNLAGVPLSLRSWQTNTAYAIGDIIYSTNAPSYVRMECVVAGTSGIFEPVWSEVGLMVTDGTALWIIDDIRDGFRTGDIKLSYILRPGDLKANGALLNRADFPRLTKFAVDNNLIISETDWAAEMQGMFGAGDGSTTIRLPDFRGEFIRCFDDGRGVDSGRILGSLQNHMLIGHAHSFSFSDASGIIRTSNGFIVDNNFQYNYTHPDTFVLRGSGISLSVTGSGLAWTGGIGAITLDGAGGKETRPRNIALLACIKY